MGYEGCAGLTTCCVFLLVQGWAHYPPLGSLLNVPVVDDQTDQATNQEGYEHLLPSKEDRGVCIGEALPPVPKKLAERIWRLEFIEMGELLPETWNLKPGDEANQQRLLARRKKPVTELKTWVQ